MEIFCTFPVTRPRGLSVCYAKNDACMIVSHPRGRVMRAAAINAEWSVFQVVDRCRTPRKLYCCCCYITQTEHCQNLLL